MQGYRQFLQETPASDLTPEAMRRLADLQLEKDYGVRGTTEIVVDASTTASPRARRPRPRRRVRQRPRPTAPTAVGAKPVQLAAPEVGKISAARSTGRVAASGAPADIEREVEQRATQGQDIATASTSGVAAAESGPLESIKLYDKLLTEFPNYDYRDQVLYQKARAYDELGRTDEAMAVMEQLVKETPDSKLADEVQFRRGESFFMRRKYREAEGAYQSVVAKGAASELLRAGAIQAGLVVLQAGARTKRPCTTTSRCSTTRWPRATTSSEKHTATEDRRVEDTFNVIACSSPTSAGRRSSANTSPNSATATTRIASYRYLGEFYLSKQRYQDAATVYKDFVKLYPFHATSPDFSLRTIGIYETGGFPKLVVDAKSDFAARYGLKSEYWRHHAIGERPEVVAALKSNLMDLANYYHARTRTRPGQGEAAELRRSHALVSASSSISFHEGPEAPAINYQFADLLRENGDFGRAARSTSAPRTNTRRTRRPRPPVTPRFSRIARTEGGGRVQRRKPPARDRRQLAAVRRHLPAARAGTDGAGAAARICTS